MQGTTRASPLGPSFAGVILLTVVVAGCSLTRRLPASAVVDDGTRREVWSDARTSDVEYTGPPARSDPIAPFLVFGIPYDLDIVLVTDHPDWEMHEYARVRTPNGPIWLAKETRRSNGNQLLVTSSEQLLDDMPEIPLATRRRPVRVRNRSEGNRLDLEIQYRNFDGDPVRVEYEGAKPLPVQRRNGSTMGHSRNEVMAVLDLSHRSFGDRARIAIGERPYAIRRILGVQPFQLAIRQIQGGVAEATYRYPTAAAARTRHSQPDGSSRDIRWNVARTEAEVVLRQRSPLRTLAYRFRRRDDGALELFEVAVDFWNEPAPIYRMRFAPALPDPRRPFSGTATSRWVADVGDRRGHAVGTVRVRSDSRSAEFQIRGDEPRWVAERCVVSDLQFGPDSGARIETAVSPCTSSN